MKTQMKRHDSFTSPISTDSQRHAVPSVDFVKDPLKKNPEEHLKPLQLNGVSITLTNNKKLQLLFFLFFQRIQKNIYFKGRKFR